MKALAWLALCALAVLAACSAPKPAPEPPPPPQEEAPAGLRPAQVAFVRYISPLPPGNEVPRPLYGARPEDRPWLEQLLAALAAAEPADPQGAGSSHRRMSYHEVRLVDGRRLLIREAWNCEPRDGGTRCTTVPGKLVIEEGEQLRVVTAPALAGFFGEDRAKAMPGVERLHVEPAQPGAGSQVTVRGLAYPGAAGYRLAVEGNGKRWVLSEGEVSLGAFTWTGRLPLEVPPGDYSLHVTVDADGGSGIPLKVGPAVTTPAGGRRAAWAPYPAEVAWAQMRFGLPSQDAGRPLYPGRPADAAVLDKLLHWLALAERTEGRAWPFGREAQLWLTLGDGATLAIRPARDCQQQQEGDGVRTTCRSAPGAVEVYAGSGEPVRLHAPELAVWVLDGWRQEAGFVRKLEAQRLADGRYRISGDGWAGAERLELWLAPAGPYSCCPPSEGARLGVPQVITGQFAWEGPVPAQSAAFTLIAHSPEAGSESLRVEPSGP